MYDDDLAAEYGRHNYGNPQTTIDLAPTPNTSGNVWGIPQNSGQPVGTMDLSYWLSRGVTPEQIFDENGQTRPGWSRTARGYEQTGVGGTSTPPPPGPGPGPGPGPDGGPLFGPRPQLRSLDSLYPTWDAPQFEAPEPFSHPDFTAPTMQDAENEPGYAFASTQGRKAVEATKAAQGVYRSGQTLKDIYSWASEFAKQNYSGVFDRGLRTYGTNRDNAADSYMSNYNISRDVFDRNYNGYLGGQQGLREKAKLDFGRDWDVYAKDIDIKKWAADGGDT